MASGFFSWRLAAVAVLLAAETAALALTFAAVDPAHAQFFGDRFPFFQNRPRRPIPQQNPYQQQQQQFYNPFGGIFQERPAPAPAAPPVDYSKAPPPKKPDANAQTTVVVFGDSMADWLAYGLELAFAESPEMGVLRKHRTWSGLIRQDVRHDPRGEYPDWPKAARDMLAAAKPDFIVMMIGLNDRKPIREPRPPPARPANMKPGQTPSEGAPAPAAPAAGNGTAAQPPVDAEAPPADQPPAAGGASAEKRQAEASPPKGESQAAATGATHEFRSEKWTELYIKRIDETIAALKSKGVPVFWVGLPPVRGTRSSADFSYLNDLFRSRADRAGIIYVDVWDGFVDEAGRFAQQGPDFEGQIRRLRAGDGVHFTQAGARKLAHYVDREIQRWLNARVTPVALPAEEPAPQAPTAAKPTGGGIARPLSGPVIPLTATAADSNDLLGNAGARQSVGDAMASKVLAKGEPVVAPAGRADDFVWPRRGVAPVGADPVVALTTLPMTPMQAERPPAPAPAAASPAANGPPAPERAVAAARRPAPAHTQVYRMEPPRRPAFSFFPSFLFGR